MGSRKPAGQRRLLTVSGLIGAAAAIVILLSCAYSTAGSLW